MKKYWSNIKGTDYDVSINGEIRNTKTRLIIKSFPTSTSPYLRARIRVNKKPKSISVHREVAKAFVLNNKNKPEVNHINGIKTDNRAINLEWVTPKENMAHAVKIGLYKKYNNQTYKGKFGKKHNKSIPITCNGYIYYGLSEASRKTGIPVSTISYNLKNNSKLRNGMYFQLV